MNKRKKERNLRNLCPPNPGISFPKQQWIQPKLYARPKANNHVLDIVQEGMKENDKFIAEDDDEGKQCFLVAISQCIGGPCVSKKFATIYNKKIEESKEAKDPYYMNRNLIKMENGLFHNACIIPDDCDRHDPILISTFQQFLEDEDHSFNGEIFQGMPTSNWHIYCVPIEKKHSFKIILHEGGIESITSI